MSLTFQEWRRVRKISARKMASLLGIHENTYRSWEKNPRHISVINAYKISDILNVGIDEIKFCEEPNQ